jgi:DNA repair exonuclease SbcCD ATPase subunit
MIWPLGLAVLLLALLIPILVFAFDVPRLRERAREADRLSPERDRLLEDLTKRLVTLEDEVDDLSRSLEGLRDETQFLQRLLEDPERREPPNRLAPPTP